MKLQLENGDKVKLLPQPQLLELFQRRNFFSQEFRQEASEKLSEKEGVVDSIESKYAFDYFFFKENGCSNNWSIPYQAVDFSNVSQNGI